MKIVTSILLFLTGCGLIAYSYIASLVTLVGDVEQTARSGDESSAFAMIVDFILSGEIPQVTGFLYFGLLLIVFSFVYLIRSRKSK
ncbi:MAG: hypothetical protein AAF936_00060 [Pseudomonadota bacterium]